MALFGLFGKKRITESFFVNSYGNDQTRGLYTFQVDVENGEILYKKFFKTPSDPIYSFNYGRFVCVTYKNRSGTQGDGGICSYAATSDILALVSHISDNGKTYVHACTNGDHETADRLYAVDYYNSEILVARIEKKKLIAPCFRYQLEGHSIDPKRQNQPHPCYVDFTPDKQRLIVVDLGLDKVLLFKMIDREIALDEEHSFDLQPGSGPNKILFNKAGTIAYVLNELSCTINVYKYNDLNFELIQTIDTYPKEGYEDIPSTASQMIFSEKEERLYVTNCGHDSLSLFIIDKETGMLTYKDFVDTSPNPRDLKIFKDRWIVVVCQKGGVVESYEYREERGGMLFETKYSYMVNEPVCITKFETIY
ncbi:MAG TPA: lactonase family protein [Candidatus Erysipelatoclostridium merdavium]|uniref:Lactonase family protein n=1 Tax=Candidatus Erysipelatoclostridium merdavium TaxID=2838566 RepID=A0A9D2BMY0_9FIRM|nr:lactonase family protein [Candidatus Erysipelatoclostridium merdavium]